MLYMHLYICCVQYLIVLYQCWHLSINLLYSVFSESLPWYFSVSASTAPSHGVRSSSNPGVRTTKVSGPCSRNRTSQTASGIPQRALSAVVVGKSMCTCFATCMYMHFLYRQRKVAAKCMYMYADTIEVNTEDTGMYMH